MQYCTSIKTLFEWNFKNRRILSKLRRKLFGGTVTPINTLFGGTVPPNNTLFGGTVPPNNILFCGTVPPNSTLFGGTPDSEIWYLNSIKSSWLYEWRNASTQVSMQ